MAEKSIELDSVEIAAAVFGNCDCNIRLLEKEFQSEGIQIHWIPILSGYSQSASLLAHNRIAASRLRLNNSTGF